MIPTLITSTTPNFFNAANVGITLREIHLAYVALLPPQGLFQTGGEDRAGWDDLQQRNMLSVLLCTHPSPLAAQSEPGTLAQTRRSRYQRRYPGVRPPLQLNTDTRTSSHSHRTINTPFNNTDKNRI